MITKQMTDWLKIASVSERCAWGWGQCMLRTKQMNDRLKIRSVSDGSAWGWGPMRTN